jgi:hypothetical protein
MPRPVRVFQISPSHEGNVARSTSEALPLSTKPSIAVLPFENSNLKELLPFRKQDDFNSVVPGLRKAELPE